MAFQAMGGTTEAPPDEKVAEIAELKEKCGAIILAHNYQRKEIQELADIRGDSLQLSREATKVPNPVIVFCGVQFMAESAAILNPRKTVLLPVKEAGCPLADMATADEVKKKREKYPDAAVVSYINTSAAVKAVSDICCTSANAAKVVNSLKENQVIFLPDRNLGKWVARHTDKEVILWEGYCATHDDLELGEVEETRKLYPEAEIMAHPECGEEILDISHAVLGTAGMLRYAAQSDSDTFIVCTEHGMVHALKRECPGKTFIFPSRRLICPNMKLTTLKTLANSLRNGQHVIEVDDKTRNEAVAALEKMLDVV